MYSENSRLNVFFHSTEKYPKALENLLPFNSSCQSLLYNTASKRKSQRIKCRQGKLRVCLQTAIEVLCHKWFYLVSEMAIEQLIPAQRLTDTLTACLHNLVKTTSERFLKHKHNYQDFGSKPGHYALTILSCLNYPSCMWYTYMHVYFHPPKKPQVGKDYQKQQMKSLTTVSLQLCFIFWDWGGTTSQSANLFLLMEQSHIIWI